MPCAGAFRANLSIYVKYIPTASALDFIDFCCKTNNKLGDAL